MQGQSERKWRDIAHCRGGREARLAWGGIRKHDAFLGHEMRGPGGTERGCVSMSGEQEGQSARKGNGVKRFRQIISPHSPSSRLGLPVPQPLRHLKVSLLSFRPSLLQFVSIISLLLNRENPIFEPVCVLYLFLFCLYFSDRNDFQL